jgi:hypothetical protein
MTICSFAISGRVGRYLLRYDFLKPPQTNPRYLDEHGKADASYFMGDLPDEHLLPVDLEPNP